MKTNFWKFAAAFVVGLAAVVACDKQKPEPTVEPVFPTEIYENYEVVAGEFQTFTITPNMDWEISVPTKDIQWFWLAKENDDQKYDKIKGEASADPIEIIVGVNDTEEFSENRTVDVTLTMGGQSKVVAKLMRPAKSRVLKVFAATLDEYGFIPSEDSENIYAYTSEPVNSLTLAWPEDKAGFMMPIKIEANFEWQMTYPDWITYTDPNEGYGKVGIAQINLNGVPSKYPVNGASDKIVITAVGDDSYAQEIEITIPGCADRISFGLWNSVASPLTFNAAGQYNSAYMGYVDGPAGAFINSTKNARVIAVEWNSSWEAYDTKEASWITISLGAWSESADVIQERDVEISVSENTTNNERKALLFFLPESVTVTEVASLFNDQGTVVLADYAKYTMELIQAAKEESASYISLQKTAEDLASVGGAFGVATEPWLPGMFGVSSDSAYKLTYSKTWSRDEATLMFAFPYASYEVYNADGNRVNEENYWLQLMELGENKTSAIVDMNSAENNEGYIKFLDAEGNGIAVIWCVFDPSFTPSGDSGSDSGSGSVEFIGEMAMYASMLGASLEEVTSGEYYEMYKEYGCPIYSLTYTSYQSITMPMSISTPQYLMAYVMPDSLGEYIWAEATLGGATINMQLPEDVTSATAAMMFYGMDYSPVLVLICNWAPIQ